MAVKRPFRRKTARTTRNMIRRIDEQQERKTFGKWFYVPNTFVDLTVGSSKYGVFIALPRPGNKVTIYGMDLVISISLSDGQTESAINGALQVCHDREGQDPADFAAANMALPEGHAADLLARPRSFLPFSLVNQATVPQRNAVIPYRFFRGHKIVLNPAQRLLFMLLLSSQTTSGVKISMNITGRYRFMQTHE